MGLDLTLTQKGILIVSVPLLCEMGFVAYVYGLVEQGDKEIKRQEHARELLVHMNSLTRKLVEAGTTAGSYSCPIFLGNYADVLATTSNEFKALESLTRDDPNEFRTVKQVELLAEEGVSLVKQGRRLLSKGQDEAANVLLVTSLKPLVKRISTEAEFLTNEARSKEAIGPQARARMQDQVRYTLIGGIALNILVAVSLAIYFMKNISKNVATLMDNTVKLARREELNPPLPGNDEISHLDRVVRDMAKAIESANKKERAIFENARDMICTIADGGVLRDVSPACSDVLGYSPSELDGKWFVELVVESDVPKTIELLKQLFNGFCEQPFEARMKRKDGRIIHVLWSAQWSQLENCCFCVAHEITQRKEMEELLKESEARTRSILETTPVGILTLDSEGRVELGNPAVATMFGCDLSDLVSRSVVQLFKSPAETTGPGFIRHCCDKTIKLDAQTKSGRLFPAELTIKEFDGSSGKQYLMVLADISERQQIEQLKQDFVAMVSHELRTPLTSVQGFLELLNAGGYGAVTDAAKNKCDVASRNVSRLIDLINDILDNEKLESGKFEYKFAQLNLNDVVSRSIDAVKDFADKSGVSIAMERCDGVVVADQGRLIQVVINLLSNAIKFSPKGSQIVISVRETPNFIELAVRDFGSGIPENAQVSIFERFTQVPGAQSKHVGSGLGLAICKKIIEQHQGQIGVDSVLGEGSRFWFRLPTVKEHATV